MILPRKWILFSRIQVDDSNLADPNNDLVDTIPEMFTDERTLDYSSPPYYMMMSMMIFVNLSPIMIISSDFLLSSKCDSVLYEDFSKVDALPSTNNEDKVFNPGILIHENLFEVPIRATPDKNVKKISISNASLILEDFNPPLYELLSTKKFSGLKLYSRFHPKIRKKFSTPGL
ncbi:reverse transcriptase domain-containing protein [Tanacetum coccineum]